MAGNLFLGRFLSKDMASVPDIDLDFPRDVRARLIEEIVVRYGAEHAALVAAFPTFRTRMAIRELGGALALPDADLERLSRLSDGWSEPGALEEEMRRLPDGEAKLRSPRWRALAERISRTCATSTMRCSKRRRAPWRRRIWARRSR